MIFFSHTFSPVHAHSVVDILHQRIIPEKLALIPDNILLKSEKAFENIVWQSSYEVQLEEKDKDEDIRARREVNCFLQGRMKAILLDGYVVPGITAQYVIQNKLVYHKEGGFYE